MTEYSENLSIVMSQNGRKSYHFVTPLLEGYMLGKEPYREFREGVAITTFLDDSLSTVDAVLTANYAIYYAKRDLWEARGNVEVEKSDGTELYTQQLFWNVKAKRIYSNVDTKVVQKGSDFVGEGFESDDEFKDWRFRRSKGRMEVDMTPQERADSLAAASATNAGPDVETASAPDAGLPHGDSDKTISAETPASPATTSAPKERTNQAIKPMPFESKIIKK